ncbi:tetratricopeptide repeat protein [Plantactinospora veratri]|uniref:Tetratricopeptide repeat protein n=1 Tax=Plantactinospora veratri TaxID=1436122 RepID=A0ABU7SEY9_9ACTN
MSQPPQLAAVQGRARALRDGGDDPGARRLLAQALDAARPAYGKDHPEVLGTVGLLAQWHREADDPAAARRLLEEAIVDGQRRWGDADPLMLSLTFELGAVAEELGNRHEARRNFGRIASLGAGVLGEDHWQVRAARDYLGEAPGGAAPEPVGPLSAPPAPLSAPPAPLSAPLAGPPMVSAPPVTPPLSAPPARPAGDGLFRSAATAPAYGPATEPAPARPVEPQTSPYAPSAAGPTSSTYPPYSAQSVAQLESYPVIAPTPAPVPPAPAPEPSRGRGSTVAAAVAAAAAVVAAIVVVVAVVVDKSGSTEQGPTDERGEPVVAGEPPTDVKLVDEGSAITISWTDPSGGTVPFVVAGGRAGQQTKPMTTVGAGETTFKVNALNPKLDYCFSVLAVYSTNEFAPSDLACTKRDGAGATPR